MAWWDFFRANKPKVDLPKSQRPSPYGAATLNARKRSRTYNDTCYYRRKVLKFIADHSLSSRPDCDTWVAQVDDKLCLKFGMCVQLAEAVTLRYLRKETTIPVPKVYCAFVHRGETYILMERIDGEPIGKNWTSRSQAENASLIFQLSGILKELRGIPHPRPGALAAADMQSLYDPRCWKGYLGFGPFANESDFNYYLRCGIDENDDFFSENYSSWVTTEDREDVRRLLEWQRSTQHRICFTHGDLHSGNILVKDGRIVALIDFETAGWYPEYWEYTMAMNVSDPDAPFWRTEIPKFLQEYPVELKMESLRRKHFGPRGFRNCLPWDER